MNKLILILVLISIPATTVWAQDAILNPFEKPLFQELRTPTPPTTKNQNCIKVSNKTEHAISGDFVSDKYEKESEWGDTMVSNRHKFKIQAQEAQTICPAGPYFGNGGIEFVIRRAWPVFRCMASLGQDLEVTSTVMSDGSEKITANCL